MTVHYTAIYAISNVNVLSFKNFPITIYRLHIVHNDSTIRINKYYTIQHTPKIFKCHKF